MDSAANPGTSVMIILLLWRIVRLINGFMMHEKQRDEKRIKFLSEARKRAVGSLKVACNEKTQLEFQLTKFRDLCISLGATPAQIAKCDELLPVPQDNGANNGNRNEGRQHSKSKLSDSFFSIFQRKSGISLNRAAYAHDGANASGACLTKLISSETDNSASSTPRREPCFSRDQQPLTSTKRAVSTLVPIQSVPENSNASAPLKLSESVVTIEDGEANGNKPDPQQSPDDEPITIKIKANPDETVS